MGERDPWFCFQCTKILWIGKAIRRVNSRWNVCRNWKRSNVNNGKETKCGVVERTTSNCLSVSSNIMCLSWRDFNWFCNSDSSYSIIDSQSFMTASLLPSCNNRNRSFSVETTISSEDAKSLLVKSLGNWSLAASKASIHEALSSLDRQRRWRVFVPLNMDSLLSSDLLARIEETCKTNQIIVWYLR